MNSKQRSFRVEAIVLKHSEYGEADRMLNLYTRERGKIRAQVKGARKLRSRKAGHVEPFSRVTLQLATTRNWYLVTQAEAIDTCSDLRKDLQLIAQAAYVAELLDKFTYDEGQENELLYPLLMHTYQRLNQGLDAFLTVRFYEIHLLDLLGFRPELEKCVVSEQTILPEDQYFSASLGGVVSPAIGKTLAGATPVSMQALKYMRFIQRSRFENILVAQVQPSIRQEIETLMQHYITFQLERSLNSPRFLRRLRQIPD